MKPVGTYVRAIHGELVSLPTSIEMQLTENTVPAPVYIRDRYAWLSNTPGRPTRAQRRKARYQAKLARRPRNNGFEMLNGRVVQTGALSDR